MSRFYHRWMKNNNALIWFRRSHEVRAYSHTYIIAIAICHLPQKPTSAGSVATVYADLNEYGLDLRLLYDVLLKPF